MKANYGTLPSSDVSRLVVSTAQLALLMLAPWALFATLTWALMCRWAPCLTSQLKDALHVRPFCILGCAS